MSKPVLVYIAGPYRARTAWQVAQNIRAAEAMALQVAMRGGFPVTPHLLSGAFGEDLPDEFWLNGDLELMRRCDAVMLTGMWRESSGTQAEVNEAKRNDIPVFESLASLATWIEERE